MSPSIAGATTTGADVARHVAVTTSPASPLAIAPSQCAVAGRDDDRVGRVGDDDVADPAVGQQVEDVGLDRVARQRRERQRADEAGRGRRQHHRDVGALGAQQPEQLDGLVGGDRAGDAEPDEPARRGGPARAPARRSRQAQRERFAAADLGVEDGQALERQVGVDGVDAFEAARPRRRGQAAGQDRPDVLGSDLVRVGELARGSASRSPAASAW